MKKYFLALPLLLILLIACTNTPAQKKEATLDKTVINKITGDWYGNQQKSQISFENGYLYLDEKKLVITSTDQNRLSTHLIKDEDFVYNFELKEEQLNIYPTIKMPFDPKNPASGGALAPIYLERVNKIDFEKLFGTWQSTETDYPIQVKFNPTFQNDHVLILEKNSATEDDFTESELTLIYKTDTLLSFLNQEQSLEYRISFLDDGNLIIITSSYPNKDNSPNVSRPYILSKE